MVVYDANGNSLIVGIDTGYLDDENEGETWISAEEVQRLFEKYQGISVNEEIMTQPTPGIGE